MGMFVVIICLTILLSLSLLLTLQGAFEETSIDSRVSRKTDIKLSLYISKMAELSNKYETYVTDLVGHDYTESKDDGDILDSQVQQEYTYNPSEGLKGTGIISDREINLAFQGRNYKDYIKNENGILMNEIYSPIYIDNTNFKKIRNINLFNNLIGLEKEYENNQGRINAHLKYLQMQQLNDDIKNLYVDRGKMAEELQINLGDTKGLVDNLLKVTREMRTYYIYKPINTEITQFMYLADKEIEEGSGANTRKLTYIGNSASKARNVNYTQVKTYQNRDYINGQSGLTDVSIPKINAVADKGLMPSANTDLDAEANRIYREIENGIEAEYQKQNEKLQEKIQQEKIEAEALGLPYNENQVAVGRDISDEEDIGGYDTEYDLEIKKELENEKTRKDIISRIKDVPVQANSLNGQPIKNLLVRVISPYGRYKITYKKVITRETTASYSEWLEYGDRKTISLPTVKETFVFDSNNKYLSDEYSISKGRKEKTLRARKKSKKDDDDGLWLESDENVNINIVYEVEEVTALDSIILYQSRDGSAVYLRSTPLIEITRLRNPDEDLNLISMMYENVENNYLYESDYMDWALSEVDSEEIDTFWDEYDGLPHYVGDPGGKLGYPSRVFGTIKGGCAYGYRMHPIYKTKKFHTGIDINRGNSGLKAGDDVLAAEKGVVAFVGTKGSYGLVVIIDHGGGIATLYAHNSRLNVRKGDEVRRGQVIAKVGSTGASTGPHIHFEVRVNGNHDNPMKYFGSN